VNREDLAVLTDELKIAAREAGADLLGIAPIERFDGVAPEHDPQEIFPEARSVVVVGKRLARGCFRGVEEGTQFALYAQFGGTWVPDRFLALTTVGVATFLEDQRWEAVPLPNLPPEAPAMGIPVREGALAPNVMLDFDDAAVRAGLGQIGYSGELLTPEFGPRQRLQVILTDAPLEATPLCEKPVCDLCKQCVTSCPLGAMTEADETELTICGLQMPLAAVNWDTCRGCQNGALPNAKHPAGKPDRLAALCMRSCIHHLEEEGRVSKGLKSSFRRRAAWQVDSTGKSSLVEES
jgi:epoxyqueuosine reductase